MPDDPAAVTFRRYCPDPSALVILPWHSGVSLAHRSASTGHLHGLRDVSEGANLVPCLTAWLVEAAARGLPLDDQTGRDLGNLLMIPPANVGA